MSLNWYERKKNIPLAVKAFSEFLWMTKQSKPDFHLVIAGGYDDQVSENKEIYEELSSLTKEYGIWDQVTFLKSISNEVRVTLLNATDVMLYTPENEHFGIVPVEAMYCGCIVFACNSGGPTESLVDGKTGFLLNGDSPSEWAKKLEEVFNLAKL